MSNKKCCVPGCKNGSKRSEDTLHKFPQPNKDLKRFNLWVYAVGGAILSLTNDHIVKYRRVCHIHFEEKYWCSGSHVSNNAIPTKHLSEHSVKFSSNCDNSFLRPIRNAATPGEPESKDNLHQYPNPDTDKERFLFWVRAIGPSVLSLDDEAVLRKHRVCRDHFELKYRTRASQLSINAVPTLFLPGFTLHRFPDPEKRADRFKSWISNVGGGLSKLDPIFIHNNRRICCKHFEKCHIYPRNRLCQLALPVLHILGNTSTEFQSSEARLQGETHKDHTYDVTDRTIVTVGTQRILEKCIDLNPDAKSTQIEAAPEIEPVPEVEEAFDPDYELHVSPSSLPEVEDSGGEAVFSWQREEELIEADDPEDPPAPAPPPPADPTLALFCESDPAPDPGDPAKRAHAAADADPGPEFDPDPDIIFDPQPDQAVPSVPAPVDNRCKDCGEVNKGFEFWCVQCAGGALCGACAGRAPHHAHYVLRAPMGCSRARTQAVLTMIRQQAVLFSISQQLQNENLLRNGTVDDDLKLEVKEEPAEVPPAESSAAEPDPLACEPHVPISLDDTLVPEFPHDLIEPVSLRSPISLHSPRSSSRWPHSPTSLPSCPASPPEPTVTPEPATHEADKTISKKIVEHHEPLQPPRLRKPTDAHEEILVPTKRKLVKVSPAEVKRAFLSHIERVVTTQNKQLKVYRPHVKLTPEVRDNVVTTQHEGPTYEGNLRTTRLQARGQAPIKVTSEAKSSETVIIDDDVADETVEYLEEGLESDIETVDNVDNHEADVLDEDDFDDDVLDEDYLLDEDDLEKAELEEDYLSDEEIIVRNVPGRRVKRKKDAEETLPVKGPSESMVRALPSKAVIQVRPLSSLEIRNWTSDRKRLRKD